MWRVTLAGLRARWVRIISTGIAVMLGVSFVAGTFVLTDTVQRAFDDLFANVNKGTDAVVRGKEPFHTDFGSSRPAIPSGLLSKVRTTSGVAEAEGNIQIDYAQIVAPNGKAIGNPGSGAPSLGFIWSRSKILNPFQLVAGGRGPEKDSEVVIDLGAAKKGKIKLGDTVRVLGPDRKYTVVGTARFGSVDSPLGASIVLFTEAEAARVKGYHDKYDAIDVVAAPGVTQTQVRSNIERTIKGTPRVEVRTGAQLTKENQNEAHKQLGFFSTALLVFAAVALLVGSFIIYNTFSIIVAQQTRENALLRAIGASGSQVTRSVLGEAFFVGLIAAALGLFVGIGLSKLLEAAFGLFGVDIPGGGTVIAPRTFVAALIVGLGITMLSAVLPARKAARVPPVAAMRDVAIESTSEFGTRMIIGVAITALGVISLIGGLVNKGDNAIWFVAAGAVVVFIGMFVLGPVLARPFSRLVGGPIERMRGMPGRLARENAMRNPKRTARTAAALMIGVALVALITIFAASLKRSVTAVFDDQLKVDYIIQPKGQGGGGSTGFNPEIAKKIARLPEIAAASPMRFAAAKVGKGDTFVIAVDPKGADQVFTFTMKAGRFADLGDDGVAVASDTASKHNWHVGSKIAMTFTQTGKQELVLRAIYESTGSISVLSNYTISTDAFDKNVAQPLDVAVFAKLKDGVSLDAGRRAVTSITKTIPTLKVQDEAQFKKDQANQIGQIANMIFILLALSVIIALFGISNTLKLSIYERTRELGLLRAVGTSRSQVRTAVRWEAVLIALFGTALGIAIGVFFGFALVRALRDTGLSKFVLPFGQLVTVVFIAAIFGVFASIRPARRAAKLQVLEAIAHE